MALYRRAALAVVILITAYAWGQAAQNAPNLGYVYPAGGQQGSSFQIIVAGQKFYRLTGVIVSGEGVHTTIKYAVRPYRRLDPFQRRELIRRLAARRAVLAAAKNGTTPPPAPPVKPKPPVKKAPSAKNTPPGKSAAQAEPETLPDIPILNDLDTLNPMELDFVESEFLKPRPVEPVPQFADKAIVDVVIDPNAAPGDREIRVQGRTGLSNPVCFEVGTLPEIDEHEPNDRRASATPDSGPAISLPAVLNGQIMPGDIDRFRIHARKGQRLVIAAQARHLIPYLADAVPGWFQAVLTLYDAKNHEVAYDDDYRFDPDPVIFYAVPKDGDYEIEIRDAIYRGREDFVYRISVGQLPFVTQVFPLGGMQGTTTLATLAGWNLPTEVVPFDTQPGARVFRQMVISNGRWRSNPIHYMVDNLPERDETEPNDTIRTAQFITLPQVINGRIGRPGDVDYFHFTGHAGEQIAAEVFARRLLSPLDSLLRLTDASGHVLAWNDDFDDKAFGLITDQADSYFMTRLPKNGGYFIQVSDTQHHGGPEYAYRLVLGPPRPDFALRMTPPSINMLTGRSALVTVYAIRKDGFNGAINIIPRNVPEGLRIDGGRIPQGRDHIRMTLTAPMTPLSQPFQIQLEGQGLIDGQTVVKRVVPAEHMMQAFIYWSLVPRLETLATVNGPRRGGKPVQLVGASPVRVPEGASVQVHLTTPNFGPRNVQLDLSNPPKGISIGKVETGKGQLAFALKADGKKAKAGLVDNLIIEAYMERVRPGGKKPGKKQRISLGYLPAIPFEVTAK